MTWLEAQHKLEVYQQESKSFEAKVEDWIDAMADFDEPEDEITHVDNIFSLVAQTLIHREIDSHD